MKIGINELRVDNPSVSQLTLIKYLEKFKGCQLLSITNVVNVASEGVEDSAREFLFIKPAGPEDFTIDDTVYRVLEDGDFEASTVKNVWHNYLVVESIQTGKEIACHFRDVFHDSDSGAARTASKERREIWESNVLRSLSESHSGIHGALNRQAHQVEYKPQQEPDGSIMGDSGF